MRKRELRGLQWRKGALECTAEKKGKERGDLRPRPPLTQAEYRVRGCCTRRREERGERKKGEFPFAFLGLAEICPH